jgi:hypothetical protein
VSPGAARIRRAAAIALGALVAIAPRAAAEFKSRRMSEPAPIVFVQTLASTPYPITAEAKGRDGKPFFTGRDPATGQPFRAVGERRYTLAANYSDNRVLFAAPRGFDPAQPFRIVVYFHGHGSEIEANVARALDLPGQLQRSGANAVLVAPQLARDANDSSPGRWVEPGLAHLFIDEAGEALRARLGGAAASWRAAPLLLVAFSGGYRTLATTLDNGALDRRVEGLVMLDAFYGDVDIFARWLGANRHRAFLWSLYSDSSRKETEALATRLLEGRVPFARDDRAGPPAGIRFVKVETAHPAIPRDGPPTEPLAALLRRLDAPMMLPRGR